MVGDPLWAPGECDLVPKADVIVHTLDPRCPNHAEVLRAPRAPDPVARIVVEMPQPSIGRQRELFDGCSVRAFPEAQESLTNATGAAMGTAPRGRSRPPFAART